MNTMRVDKHDLVQAVLSHVERHDLFDKGLSTLVTDGYVYDLRHIWGASEKDIDSAVNSLIQHNYITRCSLPEGNCYRLTAERRQAKQKAYLLQ